MSLIRMMSEGYSQKVAAASLNGERNEAKVSVSKASMIVQTYGVVKYVHSLCPLVVHAVCTYHSTFIFGYTGIAGTSTCWTRS